MAKYSTSQVQTYVQCPRKYRYQYIEKLPKEEGEEKADLLLGTIVHASLEKLYQEKNIMKTMSEKELLEYYYTLRTEKEIAVKAQNKEIQIYSQDTLSDYQRRGANYLSKYYQKHYPFEGITVIDTELPISFELGEGMSFQGVIDRLDKVGESFIITDYKTNKKLPPEERDEYREQLTLYGIGIQQKYGKYFQNLKARLQFLHFDIEDERELTTEVLDAVRQKYLKLIQEIEKKKSAFALGDKTVFQTKPSPLCKYCAYQSICPLFTYINIDEDIASELSPDTVKSLVDELLDIKSKLSEREKKEQALKEIFINYLQHQDPEHQQSDYLFEGSNQDLKISTTSKWTLKDKESFLHIIKQAGLFEKYAEIPWQSLNKLCTEEELPRDKLQDSIQQERSYRITKIKKK